MANLVAKQTLRLSAVLAFYLALTLLAPAATARAQEATATESITYTVVAGDTLFEIAQRFGVPLDAVIAANSIANVDLLEVGQVLVVPSPATQPAAADAAVAESAAFYAYARPGDTVLSLAARMEQDTAAVAALNSLPPEARLFPGQPLRIVAAQASAAPDSFGAVLAVGLPDSLVQGRTGRVVVDTKRPLELSGDWNGLPIAFTPLADNPLRQFAFLPVPALLEPASYSFALVYPAANGVALQHTWDLNVVEGDYERQEINLPPDRGTLLAPEIIQNELITVTAVWSQVSPTLMWTQPFTRPIAAEYPTTSPFGTRRSYNGGPYSGYHEGQDFGAGVGVTITAPADGIVALSEPLNVRGNAVIIDHGRGVFSGYWHLSQPMVQPGQVLRAGDVIGLVGNTGLSTGAHLHWELRIYGIAVDPMQFLDEPFSP